MSHASRRILRSLLMLAAVAGTAAAQGGPPSKPALVVFITVDQLRPDYLERWATQFTGGFRRLLDEGAFFSRGVHDHGITETAPGHASTLSGRFPYSTGISSNSAGVNTRDVTLVGAPSGVGASPARFQGTTLVDWMTAADPRTRVLSVSRKDRGAILPVGRGQHPVFWYSPVTGGFVTSTWYADTLPTWVRRFNAESRVASRYAGRTWDLLLGDSAYPEPDSVPAEGRRGEFQFPYVLAADSALAQNILGNFPWMDEYILDFAWEGLQALDLGAGPQTDILAVSLSTTDAVGHRWGPDSRELHDQVLRLDRSLGVFLDAVIARYGRDRIVLALTADHGVAPIPEVRSVWGDNSRAGRVPTDAFRAVFARLVPDVQRTGVAGDAFSFDFPTFEVDRSKAQGRERQMRFIARAFAVEARKIPGVLRVDVIDDLARADTVADDIARRWLHMFRPGGNVIAAITLQPYWYFGEGSASHGTPHDYDARVPVLFWGAPFKALHDDGRARVVDIAPTLARLLGVPPTERLDGQVLSRAFVSPPE